MVRLKGIQERDGSTVEVDSEELGGGGWPVRDFIYCYVTPKAESGYDNLGPSNSSDSHGVIPFGSRWPDGNGSWIEYYTALAAGMYSLAVRPYVHNAAGILEFSLNGIIITAYPYNASGATADCYASVENSFHPDIVVADDLVIPESGIYVLRATVNGKNVASSGYVSNFAWFSLSMVEVPT